MYYKDGESNIGWHADRESLRSNVFSISFGATRKFRFRKIKETTGWDYELLLQSGDAVLMKAPDLPTGRLGCQSIYKHTVPIQKNVSQPRVNLTFRQFEGGEV